MIENNLSIVKWWIWGKILLEFEIAGNIFFLKIIHLVDVRLHNMSTGMIQLICLGPEKPCFNVFCHRIPIRWWSKIILSIVKCYFWGEILLGYLSNFLWDFISSLILLMIWSPFLGWSAARLLILFGMAIELPMMDTFCSSWTHLRAHFKPDFQRILYWVYEIIMIWSSS